MVVNLSYSSIPLQKISQKGVDRSVENPQKRAENIKMAPNKFLGACVTKKFVVRVTFTQVFLGQVSPKNPGTQ